MLSQEQKDFIRAFSENKYLVDNFYFTGGTALAEFYIRYRYSEDLDFFSLKEVETEQITTFIKSIKEKLNYKKFDWHIDPVKLGSQFLKSKELKDYPKLTTRLKEFQWQDYFIESSRSLRNKILN